MLPWLVVLMFRFVASDGRLCRVEDARRCVSCEVANVRYTKTGRLRHSSKTINVGVNVAIGCQACRSKSNDAEEICC